MHLIYSCDQYANLGSSNTAMVFLAIRRALALRGYLSYLRGSSRGFGGAKLQQTVIAGVEAVQYMDMAPGIRRWRPISSIVFSFLVAISVLA